MNTATARRITLCADDYGISPAVNRGIRELILLRRLNATSVMIVGPAIGRSEIDALLDVAQGMRCAIGLHATLTAPFHPLTLGFQPLPGGLFPSFKSLLRAGVLRRLDSQMIEAEVAAQIAAFAEAFGRPPDYVDGHQHAQIFPLVRDGFLAAVARGAPGAWVRQCGRVTPLSQRLAAPKALLLDVLSASFRNCATNVGVKFNPAFDGAYDFTSISDFGGAMRGFLDGIPDGGLVMCHPGYIDDTLIAIDPLTDQRRREYDYLASDRFTADLQSRNVALG
jgi:predicted glycoside hydrolase/deacetylase ChbG (UPF0249 family)